MNRRNAIAITTAGLVHLSDEAHAEEPLTNNPELLIRKAKDRGHTDLGWLKAYHSFSFGNHYDPESMNFRSLRVINEDRIAGKKGFPTHPHRDMEIITYMLEGELKHKDSTGNSGIIRPDEIQYMAAGTGIRHSEFNPSRKDTNHLLQIWIAPWKRGTKPRYSQKKIESGATDAGLNMIASPNGEGNSIQINQDARMFAARPGRNQSIEYTVESERHAWLQLAKGTIKVNGTQLQQGDAIATSAANRLVIEDSLDAEFILFDLA